MIGERAARSGSKSADVQIALRRKKRFVGLTHRDTPLITETAVRVSQCARAYVAAQSVDRWRRT
jgi:hypothetical protein